MRPVPDVRDYSRRQETHRAETQGEEVYEGVSFLPFFKIILLVVGFLAVAWIIINIKAVLEFLFTLFVIILVIAMGISFLLNALK